MTTTLHRDYEWLTELGFIPGVEHAEAHMSGSMNANLINTPGTPRYLPPLIPSTPGWLKNVQKLFAISAQAVVAELWTQLLVSKMDHKEKPLYLFWDDAIPAPSPLTSLFWLLSCETWPLPNHHKPENVMSSTSVFPHQTFLLPQSTPYGFASSRPRGMAEGASAFAEKSLTGLLVSAMHRGDRANMELVDEKAVIHRPQGVETTSYRRHTGAMFENNVWRLNEGWPRLSMKALDQGTAAFEWYESDYHAKALASLRRQVMDCLLVSPGLPTHRDNLHASAGAWIRGWSECGILISGYSELPWTDSNEPIKLASGTKLSRIPRNFPRVWFGWTHRGPKYEVGVSGIEQRVISASETWAAKYKENRAMAITMLMSPETISVDGLIKAHTANRTDALSNAGRLVATESKQAAGSDNAFASAFAAIMNKDKESK